MIGPYVAVTGGRAYADRFALYHVLDELGPVEIAHGDATGADELAHEWAVSRGVTDTTYLADWDRFKFAAGPIRNHYMLLGFDPEILVVCPGGKGTKNCTVLARGQRCRIVHVRSRVYAVRAPEARGR